MESSSKQLLSTSSGNKYWDAWERFWFRPSSPLTLGFMRILFGLVVLYVHFNYTFGLQNYVGKDGWVDLFSINQARHNMVYYSPATDWATPESKMIAQGKAPLFSIFFHVVNPTEVAITHGLILLGMFCFTIGFCTRIANVVAWFGAISYVHRAPTTFFGMDTIIVVVLFYLMFAPSGSVLSVDRWLTCRRARRRGEKPPPVTPSVAANFVTRLLQVHFCFVYMASGLSKLLGPAWWTGNAIWWTMVNYSFSPMNWPPYFAFVKFLAKYFVIWQTFIFVSAYFTLALEIFFGVLVWSWKWRPILIVASLMMHLGICFMMGLATFSATMICFLLCFIPPRTIELYLEGWSRRLRFWKEAALESTPKQKEEKKEPVLVS